MKDKSLHSSIVALLLPLMLVLFISNLDQTIVATALPSMGRNLGHQEYISWIATSYLLTSAISTLLLGKIGDMYGRKGIFLISIVVFLIGSILAGTAQSMVMLIFFRALQGIGGGGLNSLVMAIIGDIAPPRSRSKYMALTSVAAMIALITGPFLGGFISGHVSWRWVFYINVPVAIVAIIMVSIYLKLQKPTAHGKVDILGGILAAITSTAVLLITTWGGQKYPWNSSQIIGLIVFSVVCLIAYIVVESKAQEPITPLHFFKSNIFVISSIQFMLATLVLFVGMLYIPMYLQGVGHLSETKAGLYIIPILLGVVISSVVSGGLISKIGKYKIYPVLGAIMNCIALFGISSMTEHINSLVIIGWTLLLGLGIGLIIQVALLSGQNAVSYKFLGSATGTLNFFKSIGGAFGAAIFGAILTLTLKDAATVHNMVAGYQTLFKWAIPFTILSFVLGLVMKEKPLSDEMMKIADGSEEAPEY